MDVEESNCDRRVHVSARYLARGRRPGARAAAAALLSTRPTLECDPTNEWLASLIVETVHAPIYDAAVKDGTITAWGWMAHNTGGKWRRGLFTIAPTFDAMWDGSAAIREKVAEANGAAARKIGEICSTHDDYIWQWVAGSGPAGSAEVATTPAKSAVSQYLVCDMAKQKRADELMAAEAPVYNRHVKAGELTGWGWLEHVVGGEYRRLLTMRGADHMSVLATWNVINEELDKEQPDAVKELDEICYTHQDYIWNVVH